MTFKEIAATAKCSDRTARKYARKLWPSRDFTGKLGAQLNEADSIRLMDQLPKRTNVESGRSSAENLPALAGQNGQMSAHDFVAMIPAIVAETVRQMLPLIQPVPIPAQKSLPFVPDIPVRKQIANIVNEAVMKAHGGRRPAPVAFESAYHKLYKDFGDRYGIDVEKRAENRGVKPIEYLEREGKLEELWLCAMRLFGMSA